MIHFVLVLSTLGATPSYRANDDVRTVLAEDRYRFCHEDKYPLASDEREFCHFVGETSEICPSLPAACKNPPAPVESGSLPVSNRCTSGSRCFNGRSSGRDDRVAVRRYEEGGNGSGKGDGSGSGKGDGSGKGNGAGSGKDPSASGSGNGDTPPPPAPPPDFQVSAVAAGIARILFFGLLAAFVAYVVYLILKNIVSGRETEEEVAPEADPAPQATPDKRPALGPVETDVQRLLSRARAAAQRGEFNQAIDDVYAALLRRLDGDGLIHIQTFRTNGDYVRDLRRDKPELAQAVRAIVADVESVQFGSRAPSADLFTRIHDRVVPLVTRALAVALFFVGLSSTLSCGHVAAADTEKSGVFTGDASPSGTHAIVTLLEKYGVHAVHRSEPVKKLPDTDKTLVVFPETEIDGAGWDRLLDWVAEGGDLVIAGVPSVPRRAGATMGEGTQSGPVLVQDDAMDEMGELYLAIPAGPVLRATGGEVLLARETGEPYAVHRRLRSTSILGGHVVVLADDRLFTNIALTAGENGAFLVSLFRALHPDVEICDAWTGAGADTPLDSIENARMTPILLQLLALLAVFFLWKGRAFGVLRDPDAHQRRAFADHVRALGLAYARAGASRHVLGLYAAWAIERLRDRVPRGGRFGLAPLAEAIAARTGTPASEVMRVLVEAHDAQKEAAPPSVGSGGLVAGKSRAAARAESNADFNLMRALDQFLTATGRERRRRGKIPPPRDPSRDPNA
ncbi:DUF4350 domain-containing protein [Polyangium aurulentum]|uniref:DUF4350 domain-containing protein n=1 Tax=Polyangium aurulentum TaxID=2567896 RepID=UPI0010AE4544|nr:DUF4350 domain-containing protein [Polyangium aurulentum]UQA59575.1 DUF4350 domain-containing protein [Polyangium aurulentum]